MRIPAVVFAIVLAIFSSTTVPSSASSPICICNAGSARIVNYIAVSGRGNGFTATLPITPTVGNALVVFVDFDAAYGAGNLSMQASPWVDVRAINENNVTGGNSDMAVETKTSAGLADQSVTFTLGHFGPYRATFFEIASAASIQIPTISTYFLQTAPQSSVSFLQTGNLIIAGFASQFVTATPQTGWTDYNNNAPTIGSSFGLDIQTITANSVLGPASVTYDAPYNGVSAVVQIGSAAPVFAYDQTILNELSLVHYYPMEETTGNTMYDVRGGVNGTYTGSYAFLRGLNMDDGSYGVENRGYTGFESVNNVIPAINAQNMTVELVSNQQSGFYLQGYSKFFVGFGNSLQNGFAFPVATNALQNTSTYHQELFVGTTSTIVRNFYKMIAPYNITQISLSHLYDMVYFPSGIDSYIDGTLVESCRSTTTTLCRTVDDMGGLTTGVWVGGGYAGATMSQPVTGPGPMNGQIVSTSITENNESDNSSPAVVGRLAIYNARLTQVQMHAHAVAMRSTVP